MSTVLLLLWAVARGLSRRHPVLAGKMDKLGLRTRLCDALLALAAGTWVLHQLVPVYYIQSDSMRPTLEVHDVVAVNRWTTPQVGDVVVFHDPRRGEDLIKRVVGGPGQTVSIAGGRLLRGRQVVEEPWARSPMIDFPEVMVPAGCLFVLGDNRLDSVDSRAYGPIPESWVVGRAGWRCWPPGRFGRL